MARGKLDSEGKGEKSVETAGGAENGPVSHSDIHNMDPPFGVIATWKPLVSVPPARAGPAASPPV